MNDIILLYIILFILISIQSIAGVGILVIGTPILLVLNYKIVEIMSILLPISIMTSALNILFIKISEKKKFLKVKKKNLILFFFLCIPSVFIGLYLLTIFNEKFRLEYFVVFVIFLTFLLSKNNKVVNMFSKKLNFLFFILVGVVHGITNSGGSLLSLFISNYERKFKARYEITVFYFFLALFQHVMFLIIFKIFVIDEYLFVILLIPLGVILGNIMTKFFNENKYKLLVNFLALLSCIVLLTNQYL